MIACLGLPYAVYKRVVHSENIHHDTLQSNARPLGAGRSRTGVRLVLDLPLEAVISKLSSQRQQSRHVRQIVVIAREIEVDKY